MREHEENKTIQKGPNSLSAMKEGLNLCWDRQI